jgi:hypothetical protein
MLAPIRIVLTDHATERADRYGVALTDAARAVLAGHERRRRNPGSADWLTRAGPLTVAYNWPDAGDPITARVVTLWVEE